jgi:hypothetical protein
LLVCGSDGVPAVASQPERHRLEETIGDEGLENGVDVARRFRFTVSFKEAEHLVAVDRVSFLFGGRLIAGAPSVTRSQ